MPGAFSLAALASNPFPTTGPAVLLTSAAQDAGGFSEDTDYAEDWGLSAALARRGRVVMVRQPGRLYRVHEHSLSRYAQAAPDAYSAALRSLRTRAVHDPRSPLWLRALIPVLARAHRVKVARWHRDSGGAGYYLRALRAGRPGAPGRPAARTPDRFPPA